MFGSDHLEKVDHHVRPYRELAAAVILRAVLDYQPGPNRKEQPISVRDHAREFLSGEGDFTGVRRIWCQWSGIQPESLGAILDEHAIMGANFEDILLDPESVDLTLAE